VSFSDTHIGFASLLQACSWGQSKFCSSRCVAFEIARHKRRGSFLKNYEAAQTGSRLVICYVAIPLGNTGAAPPSWTGFRPYVEPPPMPCANRPSDTESANFELHIRTTTARGQFVRQTTKENRGRPCAELRTSPRRSVIPPQSVSGPKDVSENEFARCALLDDAVRFLSVAFRDYPAPRER